MTLLTQLVDALNAGSLKVVGVRTFSEALKAIRGA